MKENRLIFAKLSASGKRVIGASVSQRAALQSGKSAKSVVKMKDTTSAVTPTVTTVAPGDKSRQAFGKSREDFGSQAEYQKAYQAFQSGETLFEAPPPETFEEKVKGLTYEEQAKQQQSADYLANKKFAKEMGIGSLPYGTTEEMIAYQQEGQQGNRDYLAQQQAYAKSSEKLTKEQKDIEIAASKAGTAASMAQGREGPQSSTKPQIVTQYGAAMNRYKNQLAIERQSAESSRQKAERDLQRAIDSDNVDLANALRGQISTISNQLRQLDIDEIDAEAKAQTTLNAKTENVRDTMEKMGSAIANLSFNELSSLVEGTNITPGQAVQLQKAYELEGQARETKNAAEALELSQKAQQLKMEVDAGLFGPASVQEFQIFSKLTGPQQDEYLKLKNSGYEFMEAANGDILRRNPATGKVELAYTAGEFGQGVTIQDIGSGEITQNYGDKSPLAQDNVLLANGAVGTPGIDITGRANSPIPSTVTGTVKFAGSNGGYGNQVIVEVNGQQHMFNHLNSINVKEGQEITAGDVVGGMGNTGSVVPMGGNGTHLDYRVKDENGQWIDPNQFFGKGTSIAGVNDVIKSTKIYGKTVAGKKEIEANIKDFAQTGDKEGLQDYVQAVVFDDLGATEGEKMRTNANIVAVGDELKKDIEAYSANGGDLGIFTGSINDVNNKIGKLKDPELQALAQKMRYNLEIFARSQTGAAIQDFERVEFGKILPTIYDGKDLALAKIDSFANIQKTLANNTLKQKLGETAYNSLYGADATQKSKYSFKMDDPLVKEIDTLTTQKGVDITQDQLQAMLDEGYTLEEVKAYFSQ